MLPYGIGLDIGITSVGWATVALDEEDSPYGIIGMGVRIFNAAENAKDGSSLAKPRREARSARRRLRRHRHRNERIRALLVREKLVSEEELDCLFDGKLEDIYALRVRALDELVTGPELARILIHIAQRRGFKSNRKGASSQEDGELLAAVSANQERMREKGYRSVAELLLKDKVYAEHRRNKGGKYISTVGRDMVEAEVHAIFSAQRSLGNTSATETLESRYTEILLSQRSFDEGPGQPSPYAGDQIGKMIGQCTLLPEEKRAAKATYSFEYFTLLQQVNHLRIVTDGQSVPLTKEQREMLIDLAHRTANLDYARIRKELGLAEQQRFNTVSYRGRDDTAEQEKKTKFNYLRAYHQMRTAFNGLSKGHFADLSKEQRNAIGEALTRYKTSDNIREALKDTGLSGPDIGAAETLNFSKYGHLSVKACDKLIPFLEQGMKYNEACEAAGFSFKAHEGTGKTRLLPPLDEEARDTLTSPVVLRAVSQSIKVVNAIIRERGCSPTFIKIELARELAKNKKERTQMERDQKDNQARNERIMQRLREEFKLTSPSGLDLVKMKLYEEQGGISPYSQKAFSIEKLFDPDYAEVDHIIPYSISFDDSYRNKVLVFAKENRDKGNRLPMQYLSGQSRENFIVWVNNSVRDYKKRQKLLKEAVTEEDEKYFRERNLQDTKTASSFFMNYIADNLQFAPFRDPGRKKRVTAVNGSVTSYLRGRWGITKVRANGDTHHAVDALVVACTTDGMIRRITQYSKYRETRYQPAPLEGYRVDPKTGELIDRFPAPWPLFRGELEARLSADPARFVKGLSLPLYQTEEVVPRPIFVSRMPRRKVTGAAHLETIKSGKELGNGLLLVKQPLTKLKLKNGEIENYYNPDSDRLLYDALRARLQQFGGDGEKAFAEPFYKPRHDGTPGPLVKTVKLTEKSSLTVPVLGGKGFANNENMVRIDVFHVEGDGYYYVPIYVADTLKPQLPQKAPVSGKPFELWKEMKEEDFLFSLYPNDLIRIRHKKGLKLKKAQKESDLPDSYEVKEELLYYTGVNINTAAMNACNHDNSYLLVSCGVKTLEALEKYEVDVLGNLHAVKKEKRQTFTKSTACV